jgi:sulfate transport system permease protein
MLVALYGPNSPVGGFLARSGLQVAFAVPGIVLALLVITLPFVVRTVEPVLLELDVEQEEAAHSLGAGGWSTFRRVVFPALRPAIAAGILLSFARAIGEFGSIVIIAGNITGKTLTAPVFIFQLVNQFRYAEAAAVSTLLFGLSASLVFVTERLVSRDRSDR